MTIIFKLSTSKRDAFRRGFLKGLGAPVVLFGDFEVDPAFDPSNAKFIELPKRPRGSLADDWKQVGQDIRAALTSG